MKVACENCVYWLPTHRMRYDGACRRHAPVVVPLGDGVVDSPFPHTFALSWCGEFERKGPPK